MKQYDKNVLAELLSQEERVVANRKGPYHKPIEGGPYIVLTIEELESMWDAANENGEIEGLQSIEYMLETETTDFKTYMASKGIKL